MTAQEVRTLAAQEIESLSRYRDNITVEFNGGDSAAPVMIYGRDGWTSTPFQTAGYSTLDLARWLFGSGGCTEYIAELNTDGSATVYRIEFADEADEDEGVVEGEPIGYEEEEQIEAPEPDEDEE